MPSPDSPSTRDELCLAPLIDNNFSMAFVESGFRTHDFMPAAKVAGKQIKAVAEQATDQRDNHYGPCKFNVFIAV